MANMNDDFDEAHEVEEPKAARLSLHLITKRNLPPESSTWSQEKIVVSLNKITHLRLDREHIGYIDNLELLGDKVTNVYLQSNRIRDMENMEHLRNLRFLTLANNLIESVQGLTQLQKLGFLDLSGNIISTFDIDELPQSLVILNLSGNPCIKTPDYRGRIVQDLPKLGQLDGKTVTRQEKLEAGFVVSSSEESDSDNEDDTDFDTLQDVTTNMLIRSQSRMEDTLSAHHQAKTVLDDLRLYANTPR